MKLGQDPFERLVAKCSGQSFDHIDLGLERIQKALELLGNPHLSLPPVIHVAGTNGKGSTCSFMAHLLKAHGLRVHRYTSPHLVRFEERILLAGSGDGVSAEKGQDAFVTLSLFEDTLDWVSKTVEGHVILTPFEYITATAFVLFSRFSADVLILETGLGGLKDATNVVPNPALSVITSISVDHVDFLGSDLLGIASQKAGIMKENCPVVIGLQNSSDVLDLLKETATVKNSPTFCVSSPVYNDWTSPDGKTFHIPDLPLLGDYQHENVATALVACSVFLKERLSQKAVSEGINSVFWPARFQKIDPALVSFSFDVNRTPLWLDGGHNKDGAEKITKTLWNMEKEHSLPLNICFTLTKNRDPLMYLKPFLSHLWGGKPVSLWIMNEPASGSLWQGRDLAKVLEDNMIAFNMVDNLSGFVNILSTDTIEGRVLIGGSLYLSGAFLRDYHTKIQPWGWD